jgi:hypothetical protein
MPRELLPYYNASIHGQGAEGVANYANISVGNLLIPSFLFIVYALAIYVWTKSDYKLGGGVFFISLVFFLLGIIAQTFTAFAQLPIFVFVVGMIVGIVLSFVED